MPQVNIEGFGKVNFPDSMSPDDITHAIETDILPNRSNNHPEPTAKQKLVANPINRVITGAMDPIRGLAQLAEHSLPSGIVNSLQKANDKLSEYGITTGGTAEQRAIHNEQQYQDARNAVTPDHGFDWYRLAGNVVSPANRIVPGLRATSVAGKIGAAALQGSALGAMQPVVDSGKDFASEKTNQAVLGGLFGVGAKAAFSGLAKVIKPNIREQAKLLMKEGVTPTPGQILGGAAQRAEEGATSIPLLGDAIKSGQRRAVEQMNKAAINRALDPIGQTAENVGNKGIREAGQKLSNAYGELLPNLKVVADKEFVDDIEGIKKLAQSLPDSERSQLERIVQNEVMDKFTTSGRMAGETMKNVESKLGGLIRGYRGASDYNQRLLGDAIQETQASLRRMVERGNPQKGPELKKINTGFANFKRVQEAAGRIGSKEGVFSSAQLRGAVRAKDSSRDKSAFAKGTALMQDLADAAENVLGPKVPDSGTPFRTLMASGPIGLGIGAATSPASLLYTPTGQRLIAALLTKRPKGAKAASNLVTKAGQYLAAGTPSLANYLLQPPQE